MLPSTEYVEAVERSLDSKFTFQCHKDISCFNKCCHHTDMLLTPYDIIRIKKRLGISSTEFLEKYTYTHIDEKSSHPFAVLTMNQDEEGACRFLTSEGCSIYEDRPENCRYYPVGKGLMIRDTVDGPAPVDFYFFIRQPSCRGYEGGREWTIAEWRAAQGAELYDEMNREWQEIQLRRDNPGKPKLDDKKQSLMYMASYDVDKFRQFVFDSGFLDLFDLETDEIEKIRGDEVALMKFGFKYLKYMLMLEETLKIKDKHIKETKSVG